MSGHAPLAPSSAKRWVACPGSVPLCEQIPESPASPYSAEGTWMHEVAEQLLLGKPGALPVEGTTKVIDGHTVVWDLSMTEAISVYIRHAGSVMAKSETAEAWVEKKVQVAPRCYGTADLVVWHSELRHLDVIDLKGGRGVLVDPDTEQLALYALGSVRSLGLNPKTIDTHVVQPRGPGGHEPKIAPWAWLDLAIWEEDVLSPALSRIAAGDTSLKAGDHCRFCPAKPGCPELHKQALSAARMDFQPLPPEPVSLSDEELGLAMAQADVMKTWIDAVRAEISARLDRGHAVPGWKLVPKRANRQWRNPEQAAAILLQSGYPKDQIFDQPSLRSVAQIAKIQALGDLEDFLVVKESSGSTLAPESDPREQILAGAKNEFSSIGGVDT